MSDRSLLRASGWLLLCLFLLLACGIYSQTNWNLAFIGLAMILVVPLYRFSKLQEAPTAAQRKEVRPKRICLVIGPNSANWFSTQRGTTTLRYDNTTEWFAARDTQEFIRLLNQFSSRESRESITLFFPFLPDGHDTAALTCESLLSWQKALQMLRLQESLPCIFVLYIRCSQQRFSHDPDRAIWAGLALPEGGSLEQAISALLEQFDIQEATTNECYLLQRQSTLGILLEWMKETQLLSVLNSLTNSSSARLSQVLLADFGNGFIRHGAWSRWLEETYGMLPSLAKSRVEQLPLPRLTPAVFSVKDTVPTSSARHCHFLLLTITLVLAATMYGAFMLENQRIVKVTELINRAKSIPSDDIEGQFSAVHQLKTQEQQLTRCANSYFFQNWGFSHCAELLPQVGNLLGKYKHWVVYSSASTPSLFMSGRADLIPAQAYRLLPAVSLVEKNPKITFLIIGHSDSSGDKKNNLSLSIARARTVRDWIIARTLVPAERFRVKGMGETFPLFGNDTPEGREMNRRVEIIPLRSSPSP